jgi:hypothetical protein
VGADFFTRRIGKCRAALVQVWLYAAAVQLSVPDDAGLNVP